MSVEGLMIDLGMEVDMTEFESKCYGMSEEGIRREYMECLTARLSGLEMVVMGILSDAQEVLSMGSGFPHGTGDSKETARQYLNRAKFILSEMMEDRLLAKNASRVHLGQKV